MLLTYKFKLKPTKEQTIELNQWLGTCRFVYNLCLGYKKDVYNCYQKSVSKNDLQKELALIRKEYNWIGNVHSQTIQDVTDRLDKAYQSFFKGNGFPRFAKKNYYSSFNFKQGVKLCENTNKIKFPSLGKISFRKSREIPSEIKFAIIKKEYNGWYVCLVCEKEIKNNFHNKKENVLGIDLGIKDYIITSTGDKIPNPKYLRQYEKKLKSVQRDLSRKEKGSNNKKKNIFLLQKAHAKVKNVRKDFLHKLSTKTVNENQVIVMENLQIKNMIKNHNLAKSISDAGWGMFTEMLKYKSALNEKELILISPNYTSMDCSDCGWRNQNLTLKDREWTCEGCGVIHDRDFNAAKNIKQKGIKKLKEAGHVFSTCGNIKVIVG